MGGVRSEEGAGVGGVRSEKGAGVVVKKGQVWEV